SPRAGGHHTPVAPGRTNFLTRLGAASIIRPCICDHSAVSAIRRIVKTADGGVRRYSRENSSNRKERRLTPAAAAAGLCAEGFLIKVDIVNNVADRTGVSKVKAEEAVEALFEAMKNALQRGERIELRG